MQNQKKQKPTLTGQRIKTRKRDEKEKYDPITRDQIVSGLNEAELDLDKIESTTSEGSLSTPNFPRDLGVTIWSS